ncbi:MAG TPA: hypothetical protein VHB79_16915 [Polyangiaceae bacterium]|nr:hypothetical protein [Polyangiaceae bacterium]
MDNQDWDALDPARSKLRALSQRVDRGLVELGLDTQAGALATEKVAVLDAWRELLAALSLGEEPALRQCPHCQRRILEQATRCRYCMRHSAARVVA